MRAVGAVGIEPVEAIALGRQRPRQLLAARCEVRPKERYRLDDPVQVDRDLTANPVDVVTAFHAQQPGHRGQGAAIDELAVVLVGADVAVLAERAAHVARGEEDRARPLRAAIDQLLARMVEPGRNARAGAELAGPELGLASAVDPAVPATEVAVREHAEGEFTAKLEQGRTLHPGSQRRALVPNAVPAFEEDRGQPL